MLEHELEDIVWEVKIFAIELLLQFRDESLARDFDFLVYIVSLEKYDF